VTVDILAAGEGRRLRTLTTRHQKPMLRVADQPVGDDSIEDEVVGSQRARIETDG